MRPLFKWCWSSKQLPFKDSLSSFSFSQVLNFDHAKVFLVSTTPFQIHNQASFLDPCRHFSIQQEGFHTTLAFCSSSRLCEWILKLSSSLDSECDPQLGITLARIPLCFWSVILQLQFEKVSGPFLSQHRQIVCPFRNSQRLLVTN